VASVLQQTRVGTALIDGFVRTVAQCDRRGQAENSFSIGTVFREGP